MDKWKRILLVVGVFAGVGILATPTLLHAIPPRYAARWLPEPLLEIASPKATPSPSPTATPVPIPIAARLEGFQHQFQDWNNYGPATVAMTLSYFDLFVTQSDTAAVLKPNPEDRNVSPYEMAAYVNDNTPFTALDRANGRLDMLKRFVANGIPVIVEIGIDPPGEFQ